MCDAESLADGSHGGATSLAPGSAKAIFAPPPETILSDIPDGSRVKYVVDDLIAAIESAMVGIAE
eukprot:6071056-Prorocentrum_lima.AAC.1